ncbi:hypothetical protein N9B82_03030 [Saprospiraceae bacterium]|nr:hypothetical protein [Saprospiraceae bacterium]
MQQIKKLQSEGFYAIQISASANSAIVEKVYQAKKFLQLVNSRLEGFAKVHDYLISNGGIFLVLEVQESVLILDKYLGMRNRSKKANRELDLEEVWKIISEQFRHLISMYVKWFNKETGRVGSMVARNYERFYFENIEEANKYLRKMKK